jgi:hypothetical protein
VQEENLKLVEGRKPGRPPKPKEEKAGKWNRETGEKK